MKNELQNQIQLQEEMQKAGINIICCNNCDTVLLHKLKDESIKCHGCKNLLFVEDCTDLYYNGQPTTETDQAGRTEEELLQDAKEKSKSLFYEIVAGEELVLNKKYSLYRYCEEDVFCIVEWEPWIEVLQLQTDGKTFDFENLI